jgi:predicted nucleotidyltransferase
MELETEVQELTQRINQLKREINDGIKNTAVFGSKLGDVKQRIQVLIEIFVENSKLLPALLELNDSIDEIDEDYQFSLLSARKNAFSKEIENAPDRNPAQDNEDQSGWAHELIDTDFLLQHEHINTHIHHLHYSNSQPVVDVEKPESDLDVTHDAENKENNNEFSDTFESYLIVDQGELDNTDRNAVHECPICTDEFPRSQMCKLKFCGHLYCNTCFTEYLQLKIVEKQVLDIPCPDPRCEETVSYTEIQRAVSAEHFHKYEDFTLQAALSQDPNARWCPKPGCGNAMIGDPEYSKMHCDRCHHEFCFLCHDEWHQGTCEQFREWKQVNGKVDEAYDLWRKENTRQCPQCRTAIEKNSGCNHMTCSHCQYQFCWLCGGKYTSKHFQLFNVFGCPGMQGQRMEQISPGKRIGMKVAVGTGLVVGGVLALALAVPALVIGGPIYGGYRLHTNMKRKRLEEQRKRTYFS